MHITKRKKLVIFAQYMFIQKWMESKYLKIIPSFLSVQAEILMSLVTTSLSKFPV